MIWQHTQFNGEYSNTMCVLKSLVTQNSKRPHIRGNISCLGKLNQAISSLWNFCEIQPNFCLLDTFQKKAVLCYLQGFFYVLNGDLSWTKATPGLQSAFSALKIIFQFNVQRPKMIIFYQQPFNGSFKFLYSMYIYFRPLGPNIWPYMRAEYPHNQN